MELTDAKRNEIALSAEGQGDNASINTLAPKTDLVAEKTGFVRDAPSLPAFKNTRWLKLSTLVLILYSAFVTFVTQPVIFHFSGNIILVKSISLVITSFSPLVIVQMEKDILDFVREVMNGEAFN